MGKASLAFVLISSMLMTLGWAEAPKSSPTLSDTLAKISVTPVASTPDSVKLAVPVASLVDSAKNGVPVASTADSATPPAPTPAEESIASETPVLAPQRQAPDFRLFNDPPLLVNEYGFGMIGSVVAGALSFYIGSGIESAIYGSEARKGTLKFSGIRYDNHYGAFYGGATGIILGSALTTYFVGQTDEEEGAFFPTVIGTALATGGALAIASWMGVNDEISWTPFIPLLALPSLGGVIGFNVSRLFMDHKREKIVGQQSAFYLHSPRFGWMKNSSGGNILQVQALNLTF